MCQISTLFRGGDVNKLQRWNFLSRTAYTRRKGLFVPTNSREGECFSAKATTEWKEGIVLLFLSPRHRFSFLLRNILLPSAFLLPVNATQFVTRLQTHRIQQIYLISLYYLYITAPAGFAKVSLHSITEALGKYMSHNSGTLQGNFFNLKVSCMDLILMHVYCNTKCRFIDSNS